MVDFLNINIEVLQTFKEIKVPKTLIISKADFIPKYINKNNMKEWLHTFYGITDRVVFLSAVKNRNLSVIKETLKENNVTTGYLLGYTNAGKSTLINKVLEENVITTSLIPNTTVSYIKIDLEDGYHLIDTPGFQYENPIYKEDDIVFIKKMNPKTFIKPITFQLKKGASILIEDSIRIENKSEKCNLTFYMSNLLDLKKVYDKNAFLKEKDKKNFVLHKNQDIVFKGLGFINVKSDAEVAIYSDVSSVIEIRDSFLGVSSYE